MTDDIRSKTRQWFRGYSQRLASSFEAAGLFEHNQTKGESRQRQILDLFNGLLPKSCEIEPNVVILDSMDRETKKFDGAILDRLTWPVLLAEQHEGGVVVALLESVLVAFETKSRLDADEISDIFKKSESLRKLIDRNNLPPNLPKTVAFAYKCTNPNLAFFDYAASVHSNGFLSPSLICILDIGIMGIARVHGQTIAFSEDWQADSIPTYLQCNNDALLLFFYIISKWAMRDHSASSVFAKYVAAPFAGAEAFHFGDDFFKAIRCNPSTFETVRDLFKNRGGEPINVPYAEARRMLLLNDSAHTAHS